MVSKKQIKLLREQQAEMLSFDNNIKKLCAKDAMIKPVVLYHDDDVGQILKKLKKEHINACVVITKEKKFLGEISEENIIELFLQQIKDEPFVKILNMGYRRGFNYKQAKDMINKHKSTVGLGTHINEVIKLVWKEGFHYIPVLDENGKVKGVVTPSSLINLLKDY